jgi:hypothetical protein
MLPALGTAMLATVAFAADDTADRAKIAGSWQLQATDASAAENWILENKENAIHVTLSRNGQKQADFECNTMGRECAVKDFGKDGKVSFWFSGPKLVQLETRGSEVVKRRFSTAGSGDELQVEVIPIVPQGKTEVLHFKRAQLSSANTNQ